MGERVAVAMSGGVDSSLAAAVLNERCEVIGISMRLGEDGGAGLDDAERVCRKLGIPFHSLDLSSRFQSDVIDYFCEEYRRGRTPNPCVVCNRRMKFGLLLEEAHRLGASRLASGHYARIQSSNGVYRLLKAADRGKDQSYFLYRLGQDTLPHLLFPLGGLRKDEVRRMAAERALPTTEREESQEVCFVPDGDYRRFLSQRIPTTPGDILDCEGRAVGEHKGIAGYTIGQRQGLGIAAGERLYVADIDSTANTITVGPDEALWKSSLTASGASFVRSERPTQAIEVTARIRSRPPGAMATLIPDGEHFELRFHHPQRAITPGQAVVFYTGEEVLGGGTIESAS